MKRLLTIFLMINYYKMKLYQKFLLFMLGMALLSSMVNGQVKLNTDLTTGEVYQSGKFLSSSVCTPCGLTIVLERNTPVYKFVLNASDIDCGLSKRVELVPANDTSVTGARSYQWYKQVDSFPTDYVYDQSAEVHWQMHRRQDSINNPNFVLWLEKGKWSFVNYYGIKNSKGELSNIRRWQLGNFEPGKKVEWIFKIILSTGSDGLIQVYKNGTLLLNQTGRNCNDYDLLTAKYPYTKWGIYKWPYKNYSPLMPFTRTKFTRKIAICGSSSTLSQVQAL